MKHFTKIEKQIEEEHSLTSVTCDCCTVQRLWEVFS